MRWASPVDEDSTSHAADRGLESEEIRQNTAMRVILGRGRYDPARSPALFTRQYKPLKNLSNFLSSSSRSRRRRRRRRMKTPPWTKRGAEERETAHSAKKFAVSNSLSLSGSHSFSSSLPLSLTVAHRSRPPSPSSLSAASAGGGMIAF